MTATTTIPTRALAAPATVTPAVCDIVSITAPAPCRHLVPQFPVDITAIAFLSTVTPELMQSSENIQHLGDSAIDVGNLLKSCTLTKSGLFNMDDAATGAAKLFYVHTTIANDHGRKPSLHKHPYTNLSTSNITFNFGQ